MTSSHSQTERGHEVPFLRHFAMFLPNRIGQLAELLGVLAAESLTFVALSVIDATDWAVVRMIFSDPDKARAKLQEHKIAFTESDVMAVVIEEPTTFLSVCKLLVGAELNVYFAFPLLVHSDDQPIMAFRVEDEVMAAQILKKHHFTLLGYEDMD
jgi:hypothetical protein